MCLMVSPMRTMRLIYRIEEADSSKEFSSKLSITGPILWKWVIYINNFPHQFFFAVPTDEIMSVKEGVRKMSNYIFNIL